MINLLPYRQRRLRHYRLIALFIISVCYILVIVPGVVYLSHMEQRKRQLSAQVATVMPYQQVISRTARLHVVAVNKLTWEKHRYLSHLMQVLMRIPLAVQLLNIQCHSVTCEFDILTNRLGDLPRVFANRQVKDLTQGGCPQCYRAKIDVTLS